MSRPFEPLSAEEAEIIRYASYCHVQDEYLAAETEADHALEALADFASAARFSRRTDVAHFARLTLHAADAESARRHWRNRLLLEYVGLVRAAQAERKGEA